MRHRSRVSHVGLHNITPVTLAVMCLNVYLYLFPAAPLMKACVSVQQTYWFNDWRRLLLSPLHHADDWHLYFNMASFLWKGIRLERRLGGGWFSYLLVVFSVLTGLVYLLLEAALTELTDDQSYSTACAVGFSGVLFALKVLINHYQLGWVIYIMGFPVPNRYSSWAELVLIHVTSPGTSFVGHLSGILVGLLYTSGPLKSIMKKCAGYRDSGNDAFSPNNNTASYGGGLTEEQQLEAAIRNSLNDGGQREAPPSYDFLEEVSSEELRRRMRSMITFEEEEGED